MRTNYLGILFLCGLAFSGWAHGQTWSNPLDFDTSVYISEVNTCVVLPQSLYILDYGYSLFAPVVVYRVTNTHPSSKLNRPWTVQLLPQFPNLDFSIWVCANHFGYTLSNCSDGSDNGPGMVNNVRVPGLYPGSHYIVVTGNTVGAPQTCGPYTLTAIKR